MIGGFTERIRLYAESTLDMLLPRLCAGCGERILERRALVCGECRVRIGPLPEPVCPVCGAGSAAMDAVSGGCDECPTPPHPFARIIAATPFTDVAALIVERLKYNDRPEYAPLLAQICFEQLAARRIELNVDCVVPVPLHRTRRRERGYNQAALFGECMARGLAVPMRTDALRRIRPTPSQTALTRKQRAKNLKGAFAVASSCKDLPKRVLLVDDVCTTGATFEACAAALKAQFPETTIECLAFARTLHGPHST